MEDINYYAMTIIIINQEINIIMYVSLHTPDIEATGYGVVLWQLQRTTNTPMIFA